MAQNDKMIWRYKLVGDIYTPTHKNLIKIILPPAMCTDEHTVIFHTKQNKEEIIIIQNIYKSCYMQC